MRMIFLHLCLDISYLVCQYYYKHRFLLYLPFQVKNIIYHAVKDAVSVLRQHEITSQTDKTGNENV